MKSQDLKMIARARKNLGFTLLELLVVITIISILVGLLAVNLSKVEMKARDTSRKQDLKEIQKALELYQQDQLVPQFPATADLNVLAGYYMKEVPEPPLVAAGEVYYYQRGESDYLTYQLYACLENASDPEADEITQTECAEASYTLQEP